MTNSIIQILNELDIAHVSPIENNITDEYYGLALVVEEDYNIHPVYAAKQAFKYIWGNEVSLRKNSKHYNKYITLRDALCQLKFNHSNNTI